jgi:DNA-binding GntR family transcriptional regulator
MLSAMPEAPGTSVTTRSDTAEGALPVGSPLKSELAYQAIRERILEGTYPSGHRLVLSQVASELAVSPVPVREAMRRLEAEGLVHVRRNAGAKVASIDAHEYRQVIEVLSVLEARATALAAPFLGAADLATTRSLNDQMRSALDGERFEEFFAANRNFHELLYRPCPNTHLTRFVDREWRRMVAIRPTGFRFVPHRGETAVKEHDELLALLAKGARQAQIEALCRRHRLTLPAELERHPQGR